MEVLTICSRPQCPQNHVDVGHLLRIPEALDEGQEEIAQDELNCLNLNVSIPVVKDAVKKLLPVLVWIHGKFSASQQRGFVERYALTLERRIPGGQLSTG